jgi:signal transduction histidine kinase/CheY-like chemotaxis protein
MGMKVFARSLVARITASAALVIAVLICVSVAMLVHFDRRQAERTLTAKAALAGRMVTEGVSVAVWNLSPEEVAAALNPLRSVEDFAGAVVLGSRGEVFFRMSPDAGEVPGNALLTEIVGISHPDRQGRLQNLGTLQVSFDLRPTMERIGQEAALLVGSGAFVLVLVVWGTVYIMRGITAPITRMTGVMSDLAAGEIDIVVPSRHGSDEIGRMAEAVRTFQHNAFELREAKECAEKAVLAKARFLAAASHDLRQPVQSLMMLIDVLRAGVQTPDLSRTVDHLDTVVGVLKDLLDNLLDVSRLDAGGVTANPQVVDAYALLRALDSQFGAVARSRGVSFRVETVQAFLHTDRMLLLRLLGNLVDNAIRYTPGGSVEIACEQAGGSLNIEVRDTGIGIAPDQIEAIWEEFHQVGNPERNRDKGIGLGLAIVRRLSGILRHPVTVRSTPGQGSVFIVSVPLAATWEPAVPQEIATTPGTAPDAMPLARPLSASRVLPLAAALVSRVSHSVGDSIVASPAPTMDRTAARCRDARTADVRYIPDRADGTLFDTGLNLLPGSQGYCMQAAGTESTSGLDRAGAPLTDDRLTAPPDATQSRHPICGRPVLPEDYDGIGEARHRAPLIDKPCDCEFRSRRPDSTERQHPAGDLPLPGRADRASRNVGWFGPITDIDDQLLRQEALQAARDDAERARNAAEQADLARNRFLAAASHDLRQPLQSLFLFADGLEQHISDRQGSEKLLHLRRGLDVLKGLLDALLDISRLDAGAVETSIEDFPLSLLFDRLDETYRRAAAAKGLDFSVHSPEVAVRSDRTLLGRILGNLIENAVRFTKTGLVRVDCHEAGDRIRIEVRDTGIGIPADQMDDIWTEFHQVDNPERDRNKGLGLGLAVVQRLAKRLGCRIEALSAPGCGSVFSIEVPLGTAVAAAKQTLASAASPVSGRYAVLVDDDAIVLLGLQSILDDWGYEVLAASSIDQVLDCLRTDTRRPDIIIADYRLRGGRVGTEAILKIRELFGSNIPAVLLTGESGPECARDAEAHDFSIAHKPISSHQLSRVVEKQLVEAAD